MAKDLSILIPSRSEMFLAKTVEDILAHIEADTEVIVGLDGAWADPPLLQNERVTVVYYPESIGQRAMTNQLCRLSKAKYVMKVDAHCAFDRGFDRKMIEMINGHDDWTVVPVMRNLHIFDWVCPDGHRRYQGPSGVCTECGKPTEKDIVWIPKTNPQSVSYCFDSEPHFQYFNEFKNRPEYKEQVKSGITESMSLQGSCFMLSRKRYWKLNICDEKFGSWGSQGIEVAVKSWLSGGKVMVNHNTWYAHLFRTSGGDFSFPYPISGKQVAKAKATAKDMFLKGTWRGAKYPLTWLLERFWPVKGWTQADLDSISKTGVTLPALDNKLSGVLSVTPSVPSTVTNHTTSMTANGGGEKMPISTTSLSEFPSSNAVPAKDVLPIRNESEVVGVATESVITNVVENGNIAPLAFGKDSDEKFVHKSVSSVTNLINPDISVTGGSGTTQPVPTTGHGVDADFSKNSTDRPGRYFHAETVSRNPTFVKNGVSKGILYYTGNYNPEPITKRCIEQLKNIAGDKKIVSVSLKPTDLGQNIVLPLEKGYITMNKQILEGLKALDTDVVFFAEDDVLYHKDHFKFTPKKTDVYYYNTNVWKVNFESGHAMRTADCRQLSGICAYRDLLIKHYERRLKMLEHARSRASDEEFNKYVRAVGFEPGTHNREERVDNNTSETWEPRRANIDIRHESNLTATRWTPEQFRNEKYTKGWQEADDIPHWGRFKDFFGKVG